MKKITTTLLFIIFALSMVAQSDSKNNWFIGGSFQYNNRKNDYSSSSNKENSYSIVPQIGKFISSNWALGVGIGYTWSKNKSEYSNDYTPSSREYKQNALIVKPFVRRYWALTDQLHIFAEGALPMSFGTRKEESISTSHYNNDSKIEYNIQNYSLAFSPGLDYFVNDWLSFEGSFTLFNMDYSKSKPKSSYKEIEDKQSNFTFGGRSSGNATFAVKVLF